MLGQKIRDFADPAKSIHQSSKEGDSIALIERTIE